MQLKRYQEEVLADLERFLSLLEGRSTRQAYELFWREHPRTPLEPRRGEAVEPYKENVPGVPHLCLKVPTGGGKTLLACAAVEPVMRAFPMLKSRAVVWLVPSTAILEQTLKNLRDPSHPYRRRLDAAFGGRVEVYDKQRLLGGLHEGAAREQLTVVVLSFDSLRARNKDDRKLNQENGANTGFETLAAADGELAEGIDPTSSMAALRALNPLVVVDESHQAETELSVEMLRNLNPAFVVDLTATPRKNSNLLCFVDAWELKKEEMVKLPVIVYNHQTKDDVLENAVFLQKKLEADAERERARSGRYIRPIVLFQAQPKTGDDAETFQKIKSQLVEAGIAEERIKIKTAQINELRGVDLLAEDCPVRYIVTVNALKEGWDCPFAYILATLANKASAVDVEQILGRILRQPNARKTGNPMLNSSFVLTSSSRFRETLDNIVAGLNRAGFSEKDYKIVAEAAAREPLSQTGNLFSELEQKQAESAQNTPETERKEGPLDFTKLDTQGVEAAPPPVQLQLEGLEKTAAVEQARLETAIEETDRGRSVHTPEPLVGQVKKFQMREVFRPMATAVRLPQFHQKFRLDPFTATADDDLFFDKRMLLGEFRLSKCDTNVDFDAAPPDAYKIDLDADDHLPKFTRLDAPAREYLTRYLLDPGKKDKRAGVAVNRLVATLGRLDHIADRELRAYLHRVVEDWQDDRYQDFAQNELRYKAAIRRRIDVLADEFGRRLFSEKLDTGEVFAKPSWAMPEAIMPGETASAGLSKTLFEREGKMNELEQRVVEQLAGLDSVACWHRNLERGQGFCLNGFINHYPDFIVLTRSGRVLLIETKGDDRDNSDSERKLELGKLWAAQAGGEFAYFMVFEGSPIDGALRVEELVRRLKGMGQ